MVIQKSNFGMAKIKAVLSYCEMQTVQSEWNKHETESQMQEWKMQWKYGR